MCYRDFRRCARRGGFTVGELIFAVVVLIALGSIGSVFLVRSREASQKNQCINNLKQVGLATHLFEEVHSGVCPATLAAAGIDGEPPVIDDGVTWCVLLLPYLEAERVYERFNAKVALKIPGYSSQQRDVANQDAACLKVFLCPARRTQMQKCKQGGSTDGDVGACGDYAAVACSPKDRSKWFAVTGSLEENAGALIGADRFRDSKEPLPNLIAWRPRVTFGMITDGLSNTFAIGEKHLTAKGLRGVAEGDGCMYFYHSKNPRPIDGGKFTPNAASYSLRAIAWETDSQGKNSLAQKGRDDAPNDSQFGSWHPGIVHFLMMDGYVKQIRINADRQILSHAAHRSDGLWVQYGCY